MAETRVSRSKTNDTQIVGGEVALDGGNPTDVDTGLDVIVSVDLTIEGSSAPGVGTSLVTYTKSTGTVSLYAWKVTSSSDTTLVASTGTETVSYVVIGY
jgi:hypothetical protein